ncbi:uncharacterized protein LOC143799323 [Ranitomeya variabilis]|uniref:uncharacterized protein LOC143799323 n=1 Tax=Ranitomeya variabilis TaxID=490064 RepID=UPI004055B2AD
MCGIVSSVADTEHLQVEVPDQRKKDSSRSRSSSSVVRGQEQAGASTSRMDSPPQRPAKKSAKSKHKQCALCAVPLPDSYQKRLCQTCICQTLEEEAPLRASDLRAVIREEISSSLKSSQHERSREVSPGSSPSMQEGECSRSSSPSSSDEEGRPCFSVDGMDALVKAVRTTMGVVENKEPRSTQDLMFAGLCQRSRKSFPGEDTVKDLVKREWEKQDKGFLPSSAKRRYPFDDKVLAEWVKIPKVDAAVASTSKSTTLPLEDVGLLKDPADRKADMFLKKVWEASSGAFKPAVAGTCTARSVMVWVAQLEEQLKTKVPRDKLLDSLSQIREGVAYLADASVDSLKLAARSAGLSNAARRALWLKTWKGDAQARAKLCTIPCRGIPSRDVSHTGDLTQPGIGSRRSRRREVQTSTPHLLQDVGEITDKSDLPVGGRLKHFYAQWSRVTSSNWILGIVRSGLKLEFRERPSDYFILTAPGSLNQQKALEKEIQMLRQKEVIVEVPKDQEGEGFYSPLFLIPKPDGSFRTIINLRKLNKFLQYHAFKMESIKSATKLLFPRCYMTVLDLKDAYYHLPIHKDHQRCLRMAVRLNNQVRHFQFTAMPFGLSMAPRVFTKVIAEVMAYVREQDTLVIPYLDDFLVDLGWLVNLEKSKLRPSTIQTFLGILLNSEKQLCFLPEEKKQKVIHKVSTAPGRAVL